MTIWKNDFGEQFDTFDEARENVFENMRLDDYFERMAAQFTDSEELLRTIYNRIHGRLNKGSRFDFWELFEDESYTAEEQFFNDNYYEIETEEEDE